MGAGVRRHVHNRVSLITAPGRTDRSSHLKSLLTARKPNSNPNPNQR